MQHFQIDITDEAYEDLNQILDFVAKSSPQNAVRVIDHILRAIDGLTEVPRRYALCAPDKRLQPGVRLMPLPPWRVFYVVEEDSAVIRVLAIQHGAQLYPSGDSFAQPDR